MLNFESNGKIDVASIQKGSSGVKNQFYTFWPCSVSLGDNWNVTLWLEPFKIIVKDEYKRNSENFISFYRKFKIYEYSNSKKDNGGITLPHFDSFFVRFRVPHKNHIIGGSHRTEF